MNFEGDPLEKKGKRNLWCECYNDCLDYAVKNHWRVWSCSKCKHQFVLLPRIDVVSTREDFVGYHGIPDGIFE
jgi:hypothetical protein